MLFRFNRFRFHLFDGRFFRYRFRLFFPVVGVGVGYDQAVLQTHDTGGVLLRELGVVRDHDDQAFSCDLTDQVHDLYAGYGVERARRLICQQDFGVIDKRTRDRDALHLTARKLVGALIEFLFQAHSLQRFGCALSTFCLGKPCDRQRDFDVAEYRLVGNEVVGLEYETDTVVTVNVPIVILIRLGGFSVDHQIARGVLVQAADDVEHRRLTATGRAENGHEFVTAETQVYPLQGVDHLPCRFVIFFDINEL